jgi:lysophospholipase L1-like esterase
MGATLPPVIRAKLGALTINGLGDSIIGGQSFNTIYNSTAVQNQLTNNIPAWQPSTTYAVGNVVKNGGYAYYCTAQTGPSASSGGPSGVANSITDGSVTWHYNPSLRVEKQATSMLFWAEALSLGVLNFDMSQGYGGYSQGLLKILVISGGANYAGGDNVTFNNGATGTLTIVGGVIIGVNITNIGRSSSNTFTYTINTSTGSGAVFSLVNSGSGTFAVPGCQTKDMVARLQDCLASTIDIFVVHGGTNDATAGVAYATTVANLRTCYETLMLDGRKVIAVPITPRQSGMTGTVPQTIQRINRWIRAYCRGERWANPLGFNNIQIADPSGLWLDGTNGTYYPIGGAGGVAGAVTVDGLHPSHRGAMYDGAVILMAASKFIGSSPLNSPRPCSADDGYDSLLNPGGNMLEGVPWQASYGYVVGQQCSNSSNIYRCTASTGNSASSGGPSGTGSSITDGSVTWAYMKPAKMSVFGSGNGNTPATAGSVTGSGTLAAGYSTSRYGGTAAGTIVGAIENPWSNGQKGQRQVLTFSLGSGGATEQWALYLSFSDTATYMNVQPADLGVTQYRFEAELELSGVANMTQLVMQNVVGDTNMIVNTGTAAGGAGYELVPSSGDPLVWPNSGKILLRSGVIIPPPNTVNFETQILFGFNASGGAGSATATVKINYLRLAKANVA